jgi:hypothetical protein
MSLPFLGLSRCANLCDSAARRFVNGLSAVCAVDGDDFNRAFHQALVWHCWRLAGIEDNRVQAERQFMSI